MNGNNQIHRFLSAYEKLNIGPIIASPVIAIFMIHYRRRGIGPSRKEREEKKKKPKKTEKRNIEWKEEKPSENPFKSHTQRKTKPKIPSIETKPLMKSESIKEKSKRFRKVVVSVVDREEWL
ncbi:hypothetical protein NE237_002622 [Protea cynaroides]|uniref:Uncharacterized protein n=1 Tax=Protea cynaroides TaxID=273540 RepID=A0A9Q0KVL1_9MAGN|nr:hypothetical protein NE237_002622 [Protea cynaroides]